MHVRWGTRAGNAPPHTQRTDDADPAWLAQLLDEAEKRKPTDSPKEG